MCHVTVSRDGHVKRQIVPAYPAMKALTTFGVFSFGTCDSRKTKHSLTYRTYGPRVTASAFSRNLFIWPSSPRQKYGRSASSPRSPRLIARRPSASCSAWSITSSPCSQVRAPLNTRMRNHPTPCRSHRFTSGSLPPPNSLLFTP